MTLTDQLGMMEAELNRLRAENESLKTRLTKNAGTQEENRAENRQLILRNEKLAALIATYEKHFYDFHGSAERIDAQRKALKLEPTVEDMVNAPPQVASIKERISRIMKGSEAPTNGTATGSA